MVWKGSDNNSTILKESDRFIVLGNGFDSLIKTSCCLGFLFNNTFNHYTITSFPKFNEKVLNNVDDSNSAIKTLTAESNIELVVDAIVFISVLEGEISLIVNAESSFIIFFLKIFNFKIYSPEVYPLFFNISSGSISMAFKNPSGVASTAL